MDLFLDLLDLLDGVADFDAIADFDFLGAVDITGGHYDFASTLDLGGKQPLRLTRHFVTQGFYPNDLIDKRTANVDTWSDFDGATAFDVNAKLLVATTDSDPDTSVSATYAQSGTTITITKSSHGYTINNFVTVDFTSGDGVDGHYKIQSVPSTSTFTLLLLLVKQQVETVLIVLSFLTSTHLPMVRLSEEDLNLDVKWIQMTLHNLLR
jgi:hypothetical protein